MQPLATGIEIDHRHDSMRAASTARLLGQEPDDIEVALETPVRHCDAAGNIPRTARAQKSQGYAEFCYAERAQVVESDITQGRRAAIHEDLRHFDVAADALRDTHDFDASAAVRLHHVTGVRPNTLQIDGEPREHPVIKIEVDVRAPRAWRPC